MQELQVLDHRLDIARALDLWDELDLYAMGRLADKRRMQLHPENTVTYVVDRNINYTNICISGCLFCAFYRPPGDPEGYLLSRDELHAKVRETIELGGYQILLQGGMNPDLGVDYYLDLLKGLKAEFPQVWVHGFSPPEIYFLAQKAGKTLAGLIGELKQAGLDSIPGGGAEILVDRVRSKVSPNKCNADQWIEVMRQAHLAGMKTTATMMFGQFETLAERLEHLDRIRALQDETGGFTAFIPWTFQPKYTKINLTETSSAEYLKFLALCRIYLDNIPNIQASWVTQGPLIGQLALFWGANDFGSTMIEENVVAATGVSFRMSEDDMRSLILRAGFVPRRRRMDYTYRSDD